MFPEIRCRLSADIEERSRTITERRIAKLREEFGSEFAAEPRIFRAPGRVNMIGEHTDYNDGFVMPAAIDFAAHIAASPRNDRRVKVLSRNLDESFEFSLDGSPQPRRSWSDYVQGVALMLERAGFELSGADLMVDSAVPIGSGLSSSAALEVAAALALLGVSGLAAEPMRIAQICQQAESEFVGMRCGIMDQFIACFGREDRALMLDCRSLEYRELPLPREARMVICNTMVKHELAGSEYNNRRADCEEAARLMGAVSLRDVAIEDFEALSGKLPERLRNRARHVVCDNDRVLRAAEALVAGDLAEFGRLMRESHRSLRDDYEVSCRELDLMVEIAGRQPGVYGARMTGGGFGGCTINLVKSEATDDFAAQVAEEYERASGIRPAIYTSRAVGGASESE
jgi:galactokinase